MGIRDTIIEKQELPAAEGSCSRVPCRNSEVSLLGRNFHTWREFTLVFVMLFALAGCIQDAKCEAKASNNDTLLLKYLDTFLIGKQIFPLKADAVKFRDLVDDKILLCFESDHYYYYFFNRKIDVDFLTSSFWNKKTPRYLNEIYNSNLNGSKSIRVDYNNGPFLTGYYNSKDSIIVLSADLRKNELKNIDELRVSYFATTDTNHGKMLFSRIKHVISELRISNRFQQQTTCKVVLMEATSLVANAWYNSCQECYSEFSNAIVVSMTGKKISQIQFFDSEYIDYLFKKKDVTTKDIHYQ